MTEPKPYPDPGPHPVDPRLPLAKPDPAMLGAMERAQARWGAGAIAGRNEQYVDAPLHVGVRLGGVWKVFGAGQTWDEAFANAKNVVRQLGNGRFVFEGDEKKAEKKS